MELERTDLHPDCSANGCPGPCEQRPHIGRRGVYEGPGLYKAVRIGIYEKSHDCNWRSLDEGGRAGRWHWRVAWRGLCHIDAPRQGEY